MKKLQRNDLIFFALVLAFIAFYFFGPRDESVIQKNKKVTVAKISSITYSEHNSYINYIYHIDGEKFKKSAPLKGSRISGIRLGKPVVKKYYRLEYDSTNHENNIIIIGKEPLDEKKLIANGIYKDGRITRVLKGHYPYVDFFINYNHKTDKYSFRTRLHKDSLNCGTLEECLTSNSIGLIASKEYPFLNNLYFKSRDRQNTGHYTNYR